MLIAIYTGATEAIAHPTCLGLRAVPNSIIGLLDQVIYSSHDTKVLKERILPVCLGNVLDVFSSARPFAKSCMVLKLFGNLARRCPAEIAAHCERLFTTLVIPVRQLRESDFDGLEEFRLLFFDFLTALTRSSMDMIVGLPPEEFQVFLECFQWGAKHVEKEVSEKCTNTLTLFVNGIQKKLDPDSLGQFVQGFGVALFLFGMDLMTDTAHKYALDAQVELLISLIKLPGIAVYAHEILAGMIDQYPGRNPEELRDFLQRLFELVADHDTCRRLCKDFVVTVRSVLPQDPDFRAQEKQKVLRDVAERIGSVPGIPEYQMQVDGFIGQADLDDVGLIIP
jgi:hypothetical protein